MATGSKERSSRTGDFAKGGTTAGYRVTYPKSGAKSSMGSGKGSNKQVAGPQKSGGSAHNVSGDGGKFGKGGKGSGHKMFPYMPSVPAKAGISSAR
jgi:hypothetical protein